MYSTSAPPKLVLPFAADTALINAIPVASQIGITPGAASYTDGFPPLTMLPLTAGGTPPSGKDFNGILNGITALGVWYSLGAGFPYDSVQASNANIAGYPAGARVMRSDKSGYWLNTLDSNLVNPESVSVGAAASAGWVPDLTNGMASITMTSSNVTMTPVQYGKPIIILSGVLTANLNLIFPALSGSWFVLNNCTGVYTVTLKTASGTGIALNIGKTVAVFGDSTNIYSATGESASQGVVITTNSAQSIGASDGGNTYVATEPFTATYDESTTLSSNQQNLFIAEGGAITLDINAGDVFNGQAAGVGAVVPLGGTATVTTDGSGHFYAYISSTPSAVSNNQSDLSALLAITFVSFAYI